MILEVNKLGTKNEILHRPAKLVTKEELESGLYNGFINSMIDTAESLKDSPHFCVGLAANQVWSDPDDSPPAIFLVRFEVEDIDWMAFINPSIITTGRTFKEYEGCLSIPGLSHKKRRHKNVEIMWTDKEQNLYQQKFSGFMATVIQHEFDHLCGKTIVKKRPTRRKKMKK